MPWPTFNTEQYTPEFLKELAPLIYLHYKEISADLDIPLQPVWDDYAKAAAAGVLRIFTIRCDGKLIGYSVFSVRPATHYETSIQANNDIIWLHEDFRKQLLGYRFIQWCDRQLRITDKVQKVRHHVKLAHNWGKLLERQGYGAEEIIYSKRLDLDQELNPREVGKDEYPEGGGA